MMQRLISAADGHLFDLDGTLLDSMCVWKEVDTEFFRRRGMEIPKGYLKDIAPLTFRGTAEYTIARCGFTQTPEELMEEWNAMSFVQYRDKVRLKPGAGSYIKRLYDAGKALAIVTSLYGGFVEPCLTRNGIYRYFSAVLTADSFPGGKAGEGIYRAAAARLGLPTEKCIVYDDVHHALSAAKRAGCLTAAVREIGHAQAWDTCCREADFALESWL
ncbi:MAG: HAD family phosphatase [Oscillospiraceae bacterium]|jgi:HAD superfamily hydrolase (TIGR01509 family)|nr:HAD family phosphatase [Oscillospiraceae bacterium]